MDDVCFDLITVPTAAEAARARDRLQEAGITAVLSAEEPVRLQVAEKDAGRAKQILAGTATSALGGESVGDLMDRAFKSAVLGLMVWPVEFYAFALLTKAFLDETDGNSPQREKAIKTLVMSLPLILLQVFLLWMVVSAVLNYF
jgi:hypothetical protein